MALFICFTEEAQNRLEVIGINGWHDEHEGDYHVALNLASFVIDPNDPSQAVDELLFDINAEAFTQLSDRVMATGRQLKALDLTPDGQETMRAAYDSGEDAYQAFLDKHAPANG